MNQDKWLICGTRKKGYKELVFNKLEEIYWNESGMQPQGVDYKPIIIEGCCPDSADVYAEEWAKEKGLEILHHPSTSGNYLKRNIEMVRKCNLVIAFWDGYSYGTAHTIAQAVMRKIQVIIYYLKDEKILKEIDKLTDTEDE
jgi:hypothetical protein